MAGQGDVPDENSGDLEDTNSTGATPVMFGSTINGDFNPLQVSSQILQDWRDEPENTREAMKSVVVWKDPRHFKLWRQSKHTCHGGQGQR